MLNIDIPIALGIIVMFIRSVIDITFDYGQGFFDSLTGLVFFMLLKMMHEYLYVRVFLPITYNMCTVKCDVYMWGRV